ncbi:Endothelin-converting enzyme 2 [Lucilia cuprina]|nr:Endothelin-converting enzyme 2 [Lucilia cuprina]
MKRFSNKFLIYISLQFFVLIAINATAINYNATKFNTPAGRQIMRLSKSAEMRNYMKPEVDACKDFYQYACGNWAKINPAINEPKTGIFSVLSKAYDRKLFNILDGAKTSQDIETDIKVKYFYESCLQSGQKQHNYRENLLSIMEEFGGMPALKGSAWKESEFDWLETIGQILRKYGRKIILGVDINADLTNNEINRLYIGQLDDLITGKSKEYYTRLSLMWQMEMQSVLGLTPTQALLVSQEVTDFAHKLASGMVDPLEGLGMEDKTRLRLLEEMTENYGPAINFTHFVKTWLGYDYRLPVYEYVENYIRNLRILILETPPNVVANYIMWELIQDFRLEAQKNLEKQKEKCVEITKKHFIKYLDHLIYKQLLSQQPEVIEEVKSMWQQLKLAFEDILQSSSSDWMLEKTKDKALEKLSAMQFEINGYVGVDFQKEFSSLTISSGDFFENLQNVLLLKGQNFRMKLQEPPKLEEHEMLSFTPAYAAEYNRVILPVAFLQPRYLWDDVYPKALKYGTVGYIIAHEMAHGFDDTIRKYDAKGNLNNWWDRNASAVFATRKECLRQQYGQHKFGGKLLPKSQAQGENIADNVGIRIAYAAYEMWLSKHHHTPEHLPHMDKINARQLFFISSAQIWCTDINRIWHHIVATTDVHPPEEVRVRAMFANFDAFAETFECQLGSQMHPHRKCIIY